MCEIFPCRRAAAGICAVRGKTKENDAEKARISKWILLARRLRRDARSPTASLSRATSVYERRERLENKRTQQGVER